MEGGLRALFGALTDAYDAADWVAYGELFDEDAAVKEYFGQRFVGRAAIVEHERSLAHTSAERDWFVSDGERAWWKWTAAWDDEAGEPVGTTGATMVHVRDGRITHYAVWVDLSFMMGTSDDTNEADQQVASTSTVATSEPVEVVRRMADAWNAHDLDAVYGAMTEDYREYVNGVLVKTSAAEARAADQVATYEVIPDYRRTIEELWGSGDRVLSRFSVHGTTVEGRRLQLAVACTYLVRDGRIAESRLFFDPSTMWQPD